MIGSFRHKALQRFFETDNPRGLPPDQVRRLRLILTALNAANDVSELGAVPGWRLHSLKGDRQGFWSVSISGNRRLVFRFEEGEALELDLVDYH